MFFEKQDKYDNRLPEGNEKRTENNYEITDEEQIKKLKEYIFRLENKIKMYKYSIVPRLEGEIEGLKLGIREIYKGEI